MNLNSYFNLATDQIFERDGTVLNFMEDAIYAAWGVPLVSLPKDWIQHFEDGVARFREKKWDHVEGALIEAKPNEATADTASDFYLEQITIFRNKGDLDDNWNGEIRLAK